MTHLCNCGTILDAARGTVKHVDQLIEHNCYVWALQIFCAHTIVYETMLIDYAKQEGCDPQVLHDKLRSKLNPALEDICREAPNAVQS